MGKIKVNLSFSPPKKNRKREIGTLDIRYGDEKIKQYSKVTYLGYELDESFSGKSMALEVINKVNGRFKFICRKNRYLTPHLKPHFDYACSAWYPNQKFKSKKFKNKKVKSKLQTIQSECLRYCLQLENRSHIGLKDFEKISWLPVSERFNEYLCSNVFKLFREACILYSHDICRQSGQNQANTRSSLLKLKHPLRNTCSGQKICPI